jgi:hypothetical protein
MAFATKVKDTSDFKQFPRTLKDGTNRRRVLPGIHSCSEDGTWKKKYTTHTYGVPREDDPEKKDYYTFHCVEVIEWVKREKVVLETCPENVLIEDQNAEYEKLKVKLTEELKSGKRTKDEVRALLRPYIDWKKRHGKSFWWAVNVMDGDGKYFTEKWPNDVMKSYDALKKSLKDEKNIGAILPLEQGVWVDIVKTPGDKSGTGFPKYDVSVVRECLEGGLERIKLAPIAPEAAEEAEKSCWDINDPGVISLSREQVKQLAASGDDPTVLRGIFAQSTKTAPKSETSSSTGRVVKSAEKSNPVNGPTDAQGSYAGNSASNVESAPVKPTPPVTESEDDRIVREATEAIAAAQARRAAQRKADVTPDTKPEPKVVTKPEPKVETKPEPKVETDEDIDKFMADYGLKGDE